MKKYSQHSDMIEELQTKIIEQGEVPQECPLCGSTTLYPTDGKLSARNAMSRYQKGTQICILCGMSEAFDDWSGR